MYDTVNFFAINPHSKCNSTGYYSNVAIGLRHVTKNVLFHSLGCSSMKHFHHSLLTVKVFLNIKINSKAFFKC